MTGDQAIGLFVAVGLSPFVTVFLIALAEGDVKLRTVIKALQVGMLLCSAVVISDAQGQAQAQQDSTTQRVVRLEDQGRSLDRMTAELNQFSQNQANRINDLVKVQTDTLVKVEASMAQHDERLKALESGLVRFEAVAEGMSGSFRLWGALFAGAISFFMLLATLAMVGVVIWQTKKQAAKIMNGGGLSDIKELLKTLVAGLNQGEAQSQPTRRTRS
jgi:hypothetical protein